MPGRRITQLVPLLPLVIHSFIIMGRSAKQHVVGSFLTMCGRCGPGASYARILVRHAFSIFWIPVFPGGQTPYVKCQRCGFEFKERGWGVDMMGGLAMLAALLMIFLGSIVGFAFGFGYGFCGGIIVSILITVGWMHSTPHPEAVYPGSVPGVPSAYGGYPPAGPTLPPPRPCPTCHSPASFDSARNVFFCPVCGHWL